ncbi:tyrosine-type recombinase/integrase [Saccharomonospora iraqiensis]|uniref:tyrosine-type recombinase/integrase n=1 Tax=Saccharomonospora iraqiensis TaxID=52698 RepID=UPI00040B1035|nr:tyrosine-type recombinase/integrase [Saccharomonospora iraqiensis]
MAKTYDVRVWSIKPRKDKQGKVTSYGVRWRVAQQQPFLKSFKTEAAADSFRAELLSAQRGGEAFDTDTGLPVSLARTANELTWFDFAQRYVDMKWPRAAAKSRVGNADTLASATMAMLSTDRGKPEERVLRKAMTGWAFNTRRRDEPKPDHIARALRWLTANTAPVSRLDEPAAMRALLEAIATKLDGTPASAKTVARKRAVLHNALEYAVELNVLTRNLLPSVKWTAPKEAKAIDRRAVINPEQARRLLDAVGRQYVDGQPRRSSGPMLVAFFACLYYAGLRPEEAVMLSKSDLQLPENGWGELLLSRTAPTAGAAWTDSGHRRDRRQLKQRGRGEVRHVPCPPPLTELLHAHLKRHGTAGDGRLFRNFTGGLVGESTIARVWDKARRTALTEAEYASVLARRPYDLRHACVSTWLAAGVPSTQVAEWAGHSVAVLHQIYAKVLAGQEEAARERIDRVLGLPTAESRSTPVPQTPDDGGT